MGKVRATLGIWSADGSHVENVDMQVDTGASYSQLPDKTLRDLGWLPAFTDVPADLADGTQSTVALGEVRIRYNEQDITRLFLFGEASCPKLLGSDTLRGLRLGVDPVNHRPMDLRIYR